MADLDGLRRAAPCDAPLIERLVTEAYTVYVDRIGMKPNPMDDDYARRIAGDEVWVLGHESLDAVLVLVDEGEFLLIDNVAVRPDRQGHGIGGSLVSFAERRARDSGRDEVRLYTNQAMTENRARYAHWGYREIGLETINGRRAVWLAKKIDRKSGTGT